MPRGRPSKQTRRILETLSETVGPAIEKAVSVSRKEEKEKPKSVTYCKIKIKNMLDKKCPASFTFHGLSYNIPEDVEVEVKKEVADHIASIMTIESILEPDPNNYGKTRTKKIESERFIVNILEIYEKDT